MKSLFKASRDGSTLNLTVDPVGMLLEFISNGGSFSWNVPGLPIQFCEALLAMHNSDLKFLGRDEIYQTFSTNSPRGSNISGNLTCTPHESGINTIELTFVLPIVVSMHLKIEECLELRRCLLDYWTC